MNKVFVFFFLLILLSFTTGCGNGKSGVIVEVTTDTAGITPLFKLLQATTGDGTTDFFSDQFITPTSFTVAFNRFTLFKTQTGTTGTTGSVNNTPSYTVFNIGSTTGTTALSPIVVHLQTGQPQQVKENTTAPTQGTYDHVEYQIRYFEMSIPLCSTNDACESHRLRFYLTADPDPNLSGITPIPGAILISRSPNGTDFSWISKSLGLPFSFDQLLIPAKAPTDPYLVPVTQFPGTGTISPTFSQPISPPLTIDNKPDKEFVFTLNLDLTNLFFFDNTDQTNGFDPGPDFHFNALVRNLDNSRDGKILNGCVNSDPTLCSADFWPGLPNVTLTVSTRDRNS